MGMRGYDPMLHCFNPLMPAVVRLFGNLVRFSGWWGNNRAISPRSLRRSVLGKRLYVGNLAYSVSSSDLEGMFAPFGTVETADVIEDRESGRSKGFGFVEMGTDEEAQAAIQGLNGNLIDNRELTVNEARPREERGGRGGGGGGGGRGRY